MTPLEVLIWLIDDCDLWFNSESDRAEIKPQFDRANSNDTAWLVTAPWEQLALVSDHRFHWFFLFSSPTAAWIIGATGLDIPRDCRPGKRSLSASGSAVSAEAVASFCLWLLASAAWAYAASLAATSARIELWLS